MNRIDFSNKDIMEFLNNVDVISVESKALKKYLSTKIPYKKIEYIPNSYLNYSNDSNINYKDKENIIITVGRIGTVQKNNEVLLEAFSLIAEKIPDWKLKLIGDIDANFNKYIDAYFYRNPNLINRVIFMGNIESKEDLFEEYKKVKIFTLTSIREGFPNVYSEAALNGNYIITSNIDACMDMTNNLKCGDVFEIGDVNGLSEILLKRCQDNEYLESKSEEIKQYVKNYFDYEKAVLKIDYLLNNEYKSIRNKILDTSKNIFINIEDIINNLNIQSIDKIKHSIKSISFIENILIEINSNIINNNLKYYTNEVKNSLMDLMFEITEGREALEIFINDLLNNTRIWYDAIEIEFS